MTRFNIEQRTDQPDRIYVEIDRRFDLAIIRTDSGLEISVYPRTDGELWIDPFDTFNVDEHEIFALEAELIEPYTNGGRP